MCVCPGTPGSSIKSLGLSVSAAKDALFVYIYPKSTV